MDVSIMVVLDFTDSVFLLDVDIYLPGCRVSQKQCEMKGSCLLVYRCLFDARILAQREQV
jgi:hypothetical protein